MLLRVYYVDKVWVVELIIPHSEFNWRALAAEYQSHHLDLEQADQVQIEEAPNGASIILRGHPMEPR